MWHQTHDWPFLTRAAAEAHLAVNQATDKIAAFQSSVEPKPRRYQIQHFEDQGWTCIPTATGCTYVTEYWIVKRADE